MVVVRRYDKFFADLLLHTDAETIGERRAKSTVDTRRQNLCGNRTVRQSPKWTPEKEPGSFADRSTRGIRILLRRESRELLYVRNIYNGIRGNQCMSGSHHSVKPIDADKQLRHSAG